MNRRELFLAKLRRGDVPGVATGSATSIVTTDLQATVGVAFPAAHLEPEKMAALAATGYTVLGFDNVMPLFSVWHECAALGCPVHWGDPGHLPTGRPAARGLEPDFRIPPDFLSRPPCTVPLQALRRLRDDYGREVAVVGKVFGPWTLGYHLFGVEEFLIATITEPDAVKRALRRLLEVTVAFGTAQVEHGADALTVGDHCTRDLCSPLAYRDFLQELHHELHERLPCPLILHICGDTADRLPYIRETGIECFHFDSKVPAVTARRLAGDRLSLMGGTSNLEVIRTGTPEAIVADVHQKLAAGVDIIGPECAVPLDAPWENLRLLAATARGLGGV